MGWEIKFSERVENAIDAEILNFYVDLSRAKTRFDR